MYYVGIGASAGGLEALESFFTHMPPDSGMAFIIVQHLSPDYKSMMVELLEKKTSMRVYRAEDGMQVEANTLYLIPPRKHLTIFHGKLILRDMEQSRGVNLPIDVFLKSLADDQEDNGIAVILSGTGSDGVRGVRAVKEAGGLIIAQSMESAKFDGMPRAAIETGLVDIELPPEEMPERLMAFVRRPLVGQAEQPPPALVSDEDSLTRIYALLREQTQVDFTYYKTSTINRRIERRMTVNQLEEISDYVRMLENYPGEITALYRELLIGVTGFFRDREVFEELRNVVMPGIMQDITTRELRFWVPGCSTGEEAYTLAILAREVMDYYKQPANLKIFATDIDRESLLFASHGVYPENIAADVPSDLLGKYFVHAGEHFRVQKFIREMVVFAHHNLVKDPPFTKIDLISCRNLLIYLEQVLQQKVISNFNFSLNPQGILVLGTSETPGEMSDYFESLHHKNKIYRSLGKKKAPGEEQRLEPGHSISADKQPLVTGASKRQNGRLVGNQEEERLQERLLQMLAGEYLPLIVVVNNNMELLHMVGSGEEYLRLPPGKIIYDITKMVDKEMSIPLATGLQKVFQDEQREVKFTNIHLPRDDKTKQVELYIRQLPGRKGQETLAAVFISETGSRESIKISESSTAQVQEFDITREAEQRINDLEQELQFTKENLQATIEELETSNEELQATNEELLASNEELQSTNQELYSVNEELHTVNSEYQNKIMELTEITNDLDNLIAATHIGTLFLDENLDIRKYTSEMEDIYNIQPSDVGRPLAHLKHNIVGTEPLDVIRRVAESGMIQELEVQNYNNQWFYMRVGPYDVGGPVHSGVVVTFTNIDHLKQSEEQLKAERAKLISIFDSINYIVYVADMQNHEILYANQAARDAFGEEIEGGICYQVFFEKPEPCEFCTNSFISKIHYKPYKWEYYNSLTGRNYQNIDQMIRWPDGRDVRLGFSFDITERKQAENDLERERALLNATQHLTNVGGWEYDVFKNELYWTRQVYKIHGMNPDKIKPGSMEHKSKSLECYHEEGRSRVEAAFKKCYTHGIAYDLESMFTDYQGVTKRVRTMGEPIQENGEVAKVRGNIMVLESET